MKICKRMSSGELLTGRRGGNETCFELEAPKRRFGGGIVHNRRLAETSWAEMRRQFTEGVQHRTQQLGRAYTKHKWLKNQRNGSERLRRLSHL